MICAYITGSAADLRTFDTVEFRSFSMLQAFRRHAGLTLRAVMISMTPKLYISFTSIRQVDIVSRVYADLAAADTETRFFAFDYLYFS